MTVGKIEQIYIYADKGGPVESLNEVEAVPGKGLQGDRQRAGKRSVTLLSQEVWDEVQKELGDDLVASERRANLLVSGLDLAATLGKKLCIGQVEIAVAGETTPCYQMDEKSPGLERALTPDMRGGVFGTVEVGGAIRIGDPVLVREHGRKW